MKSPAQVFTARRSITFLVLIFILLAAFFMGFYYYYVPANKENLNKYGFLILDNIKTGLQEKNKNIKKIYTNYLVNYKSEKTQNERLKFQDFLKEKKVEGNILDSFSDSVCDKNISITSTDTTGVLAGLNATDLFYKFHFNDSHFNIMVPAGNKFRPFF